MTTTATAIKLNTTDRELLAMLDRMPAHLPIAGKAAHHRLTGQRGTVHDQAVTISRLDGLAVNGLATRTGGYLGTPGRYYAITDKGIAALRA